MIAMPEIKTINGIKCSIEYMDAIKDNVRVGYKVGSTVKDLGQAHKVDTAINFNFTNNTLGIPIGRLIVDGKEVNSDIPKTTARDEFYMWEGKFIIGKAPKDATWAAQGSPRLRRDGRDMIDETIKRDQTGTDIWQGNAKRIRVGVGIINAHKAVAVRTYSEITLNDLMLIMRSLGCIDAINGDGGGSAYMWPTDNGWGRKMGSALLINKGVNSVIENPDLIIDPGHGGSDPGAGDNGIVEKDMNLQISLYQYERFKQLCVNVALSRDKDIYIGNTSRSNLVKNSGAAICISNHVNAAPSKDANGAEAIHSIFNNGAFAKAIIEKFREVGHVLRKTPTFSKASTKLDSKGKKQDYYYMHRLTGSVATTIVEYDFLTNVAGAERLKANWKVLAEAVVKAYCEFVGVKYVASNKPTETKPAEPKPITSPSNTNAKTVTYTDATVIIDGKEVDIKGMNVNGAVWLPVRKISEPNGFIVDWDSSTQTVKLDKK